MKITVIILLTIIITSILNYLGYRKQLKNAKRPFKIFEHFYQKTFDVDGFGKCQFWSFSYPTRMWLYVKQSGFEENSFELFGLYQLRDSIDKKERELFKQLEEQGILEELER